MRSRVRNVQQFVQHDRAFHRHIAVASGNSVFLWFIELLQKVLAQRQISHARTELSADVVAEHEPIVTAIESGQAERAQHRDAGPSDAEQG